jgi:flavin-dependent dehydrogenase
MALRTYDAIVVGGGPAGSSCAAKLVEGGARVALLDQAQFPRTKLCAGWVTPAVLANLGIRRESYPHRLITFDHLLFHYKGMTFKVGTVQHSIRRYEFDDYLLSRCGAEVHTHAVKHIKADEGGYLIDDRYRAQFLVGAGGTRCPVHRELFRDVNPRARALQIATREYEFPYEWHDPSCHLWFSENALPGYSWYVPKENGYLNCGVGALADALKQRDGHIKAHWEHLAESLSRQALVRGAVLAPKGYSYYMRGELRTVRVGNAFLTGDAAGLATRDLAEGIGPAVSSGQLAAHAILTGEEYSLERVSAYSPVKPWLSDLLDGLRIRRERRRRRH